jgi:hypothetical protein
MVYLATNAADIVKENSPPQYLCQVSVGTPIRSLRKDDIFVHVILEENSPRDVTTGYPLCPKGAVVQLDNAEFQKSVSYLAAIERSQQERHEAEKEIRQILEQKQ